MPQTVCITGGSVSERHRLAAGLIDDLSQRGYCIGSLLTGADQQPEFGESAAAVGEQESLIVRLPAPSRRDARSVPEGALARCHLFVADGFLPGCDRIALLDGGSLPDMSADSCLKAVIGKKASTELPCFEPDNTAALSDFIVSRYLAPRISTAVLAGGKSSRLGRNKAFLEIEGRPVIDLLLERIPAAAQPVRIITNSPRDYAGLGCAIAPDIRPGCGPLSGIHAALSSVDTDYALVVSCDIPLMHTALLERLVRSSAGFDITIFKHRQFEPLCAVYRRTCLPALDELIDHGDYRIIDLFATLSVQVLRVADNAAFRSLNTEDDYRQVCEEYVKNQKEGKT